jgi:hypothetical protein
MTLSFQQKDTGKVPFPRTTDEWVAGGMSPEQAEHRVAQDVFGHDYTKDARGRPLERGKGSASNQTEHHRMALARAEEARGALRSKAGWSPSLVGGFDPKLAALDEERVRKALALLEQQEAADKGKK